MSNEEKIKREEHKTFRNKWTKVLLIAIACVSLAFIACIALYHLSEEAIYIEYTEASDVDYKVYLEENDYYEEEYIGKDQSYIASLIEKIVADFEYEINMAADNVEYQYSYSIDTKLEIFDKDYNKPIYNPVEVLVEKTNYTQSSANKLSIKEQVSIDYDEYNLKAEEFIAAYGLKNVHASVMVNMHIRVVSVCEDFEANATDDYLLTLSIPLTNRTTEVKLTSSIPVVENEILACSNASSNSRLFKMLSIISVLVDVLIAIGLAIFLWYTRDDHTDYASKLKHIIRNYKSYIQQINNPFNEEGYQVLKVNTIDEMLEIRDTLQRPILVHENEDKTCAKFVIFTDTKILYLFQINVPGYDK